MSRLVLVLFFCYWTLAAAPFQIIFVHLGPKLPPYLSTALCQAHMFNLKAELILIANRDAIKKNPLHLDFLKIIPAEEIRPSLEHTTFRSVSKLNRSFRDGFWFYATERLFYLDDLISHYNLKNSFHLESDNMLYADLEPMVPIFEKNYNGIAAPFESDERGLASFIYIKDKTSIHALATFLLTNARSEKDEMSLLNEFKNRYGKDYLAQLPVLTEDYTLRHPLVTIAGRMSHSVPKEEFTKYSNEFQSVFDACSYGQYLGGTDPRNGPDGPGYINPASFFNCSLMEFEWRMDQEGRRVPYVGFGDKKYRINNLHIHSKNLEAFYSLKTGL